MRRVKRPISLLPEPSPVPVYEIKPVDGGKRAWIRHLRTGMEYEISAEEAVRRNIPIPWKTNAVPVKTGVGVGHVEKPNSDYDSRLIKD